MPSAVEEARENMAFALGSLFETGKYSDFTIRCQDKNFHVHRSILCPRSSYFEALCSGEFKESHDRLVVLEDDNVRAVSRMLRFLYTSDYDDEFSPAEGLPDINSLTHNSVNEPEVVNEAASKPTHGALSEAISGSDNGEAEGQEINVSEATEDKVALTRLAERPWLLYNAEVYALADKYDIYDLRQLAKEKFIRGAGNFHLADNFDELAYQIYNTTPSQDRGLRDIILKTSAKDFRLFRKYQDIRVLVEHIPEFGADILLELGRIHEALEDVAQQNQTKLKEKDSALMEMAKLVNSVASCRHCSADMSARIDLSSMSVIRCKRCSTRHWG